MRQPLGTYVLSGVIASPTRAKRPGEVSEMPHVDGPQLLHHHPCRFGRHLDFGPEARRQRREGSLTR